MERLITRLATLRDGTGSHGLRLSELMRALSYALDMTEGQPPGHCVRSCWIGMHIGRQMGLSDDELAELYYVLLLKDLGCSSNAARICELYLTDDLSFKRDFKWVGDSLPQALDFVLSHTGLQAGLAARFRTLINVCGKSEQLARELTETRCQRGATIARQLRFSEGVAQGIQNLDEHWNGKGKPEGRSGPEIPVYSRIALLSQVVDVFFTSHGRDAACQEVMRREGRWFDPQVVRAFETVARDDAFWATLASNEVDQAIFRLEPVQEEMVLDDDYLDDIAAGFGQVVDAKSPFTSGHSARVAFYTDLICQQMCMSAERRRWLKRGALLHDVGKLGVSNTILDKAGKLDADEWVAMRKHAAYTEEILSRIDAFAELAQVAGAHHERLDGKGYPRGTDGAYISIETRIITTADIFDAITADRPYRAAMPLPEALELMEGMVGTAIDPLCFEALKTVLGRLQSHV
ncbi:MAG: hypothetical protein JWL63_2450 [Rhodocyclales bacterium]|nr:hypothetical protein [Rhodocyclales bacterium]